MKKNGYTAIELLIVLTVIGILAAVAIPVYLNYLTRSKVSEGIVLVRPAILAVNEYYLVNGTFPAGNTEAGLAPPEGYKTDIVKQMEIIPDGKIQVTFGDLTLLNRQLIFTATATGTQLNWQCSSDLPSSLVPATCR